MTKATILGGLFSVVLIGLSIGLLGIGTAQLSGSNSPDSNVRQQQDKVKDPCWFMSLKDKTIPYEVILRREERELRGYPMDIPLSEAISVFNEEKQCNATLAQYPPLTENEVIAAIVAGPGYGPWGEVWRAQKDILWRIAKDKLMPKGSLLVATGGPNVQDSPIRPKGDIKSRGISIAIFLGLEHHEFGQDLTQEQIFEIRRTYFTVETIK
jgi:hypothetical protein